ncbi:MAG: GDSL family lipase, partial [Bacteroidales bacterium]|nr:GDSL family lipase [Bacteroidales bacterium]
MALFRILLFLAFLALPLSALADGPFRQHRFSVFKCLDVKKDNIVFLGNSITNMHPWSEAWGDAKVLNRGVSGAKTAEI